MGFTFDPSVLDVGHAQEGAFMSINRVNLTVRPVTALANNASAAPRRPAGYAERYPSSKTKGTAFE